MKFLPTPIPGAFIIETQAHQDERGFFARTFCAEDFAKQGLCSAFTQCSVSFNVRAGTLRGMHWQAEPHAETKLVRVTRGAIHDVILDLRPTSAAYKRWFAVELSADNHKTLYIPEGVAHGFQTLTDNAEVFYQISPAYRPEASHGARWDDAAFAIRWPQPVTAISERDRNYPDFMA